MKKIITILLLSFATMLAYGQNTLLDGQVLLDVTIDDYVGTWRYENPDSNEVFTIKLKKHTNTISQKEYDCVIGTYSYTKNGVTIEDNMDQFNHLSRPYFSPIYAISYSNDFFSWLYLCFTDYAFKKETHSGRLSLIRARGGQFQLKWILEEEEGSFIYFEDEEIPPYIPGFSVPEDVVLTKVE